MKTTPPDQSPRSPRIAIVGGARGMGFWMGRFFKRRGLRPVLIDTVSKTVEIAAQESLLGVCVAPKEIDSALLEEGRLAFEVVLIAVPLDAVEDVIRMYAPLLPTGALLMDVSSVKTPAVAAFEESLPRTAFGLPTHPMFGPRVSTFHSQTCIVATSDAIAAGPWRMWWEELVKAEGGFVIDVSPSDHDQTMLVIQVLLHYTLITFGVTLTELPFNAGLLHALKTPPFELMAAILARVFSGSPALYYLIQRQTNAWSVRHHALRIASQVSEILESGRLDAFISLFAAVRAVVGESNLAAFESRAAAIFEHLASQRGELYGRIGTQICVRNTASGATHYGTLENAGPMDLTIQTQSGRNIISTKKAKVLSREEIREWAVRELLLDLVYVSFECSNTATPRAFQQLLSSLDDVVDVAVLQVYAIPDRLTRISLLVRIMPLARLGCEGDIARALSEIGCNILSLSRKRRSKSRGQRH